MMRSDEESFRVEVLKSENDLTASDHGGVRSRYKNLDSFRINRRNSVRWLFLALLQVFPAKLIILGRKHDERVGFPLL